MWREFAVDGYIVVYSITDRRSFQKAVDVVGAIRQHSKRPTKSLNKPILLVANKSDLERARVIAKEGQLHDRRGRRFILLSPAGSRRPVVSYDWLACGT